MIEREQQVAARRFVQATIRISGKRPVTHSEAADLRLIHETIARRLRDADATSAFIVAYSRIGSQDRMM